MVYTLFYSRFRSSIDGEAYASDARRMKQLAQMNPGFVSIKSFASEDAERLTVVAFATPEDQAAWRRHPEHVEVQKRGRAEYYEYYRIVTLDENGSREWRVDGT